MEFSLLKQCLVSSVLLFLFSCSAEQPRVQLQLQAKFSGVELNCQRIFSHNNQKWSYQQLQFFLSHIKVKNQLGEWFALPLIETSHQSNNVALVGESCDENQQVQNANWQLNFDSTADLSVMTAIKFTLGVPFALNHLNPLTQKSPLNDSSMFWVWQMGHKFLRLEIANENDNWLFHLGSTGCKAASAMRAPEDECLYPNRISVELPINKKDRGIIAFDLAALLVGLTATDENSCQSANENPNCQLLFKNLGLVSKPNISQVFDYE